MATAGKRLQIATMEPTGNAAGGTEGDTGDLGGFGITIGNLRGNVKVEIVEVCHFLYSLECISCRKPVASYEKSITRKNQTNVKKTKIYLILSVAPF